MKNIKKIFLLLLFAQCIPFTSFAGGENNINSLLSSWKNPTMSHCSKSDTGDATIGANKDICIGNYSIDRNSPSQCVLGDDMGVLMLVAREVNENGAKFCVTTIYAEHEKKGDAWTLYAEPAEEAQQCHWLCKPGYTGEKCQGTTLNGCDSVQFLRSVFDKYKMARSIGVESSIAMFHWNQYKSCGVHADQEHDMILVVSKWLEGGHGAWATPFVIRARREDYKSRKGGIDAWPAGESTLLCKNGYTANAAGNDCVAIDEATCAITQLCSGWSSNSYDQSTMKLSYDSEKKCYQYRCNNAGYAFPSTTDKTCQACFTNVRGGASPVDGTCVQCAVGQIFDETATDTGYCRATTSYSSTDLQYGKGKTRNNTSTSTASTKSLSTACWTFVSADDYKKCVIPGGGGVNNGTVNPPHNIKNPIIESPIKDKVITLPQKPQPITSPGINNGGTVFKDKIIDEKVNTFDNFQRLQI